MVLLGACIGPIHIFASQPFYRYSLCIKPNDDIYSNIAKVRLHVEFQIYAHLVGDTLKNAQ